MSLGSHADRALCGKRGLVRPLQNPRLATTAVANALTVASMRRPRKVKTNLVVFPFFLQLSPKLWEL